MRKPGRSTAVCVIRVQRQDSGPLITIRINYDITGATSDVVQALPDIDKAQAAVRDFLEHASGEQLTPS